MTNVGPCNTKEPCSYMTHGEEEAQTKSSEMSATLMNRFHETLGVLHIVELAPWLWFAEGALQLKPTCLLLN